MKRNMKILMAAFAVLVVAASVFAAYYLGYFGSGSNPTPSGTPLVYDFNASITFDSQSGLYVGSFLGWNPSGSVYVNESDAVSIHLPGTISRQFRALNSKVTVSFDWSSEMVMVVNRQTNGTYNDLNYPSVTDLDGVFTNMTSFDVDNSTVFTLGFTVNTYTVGFLYRVKLWNAGELT